MQSKSDKIVSFDAVSPFSKEDSWSASGSQGAWMQDKELWSWMSQLREKGHMKMKLRVWRKIREMTDDSSWACLNACTQISSFFKKANKKKKNSKLSSTMHLLIEKGKKSCSCQVYSCIFANLCLDRPCIFSGFIKMFHVNFIWKTLFFWRGLHPRCCFSLYVVHTWWYPVPSSLCLEIKTALGSPPCNLGG